MQIILLLKLNLTCMQIILLLKLNLTCMQIILLLKLRIFWPKKLFFYYIIVLFKLFLLIHFNFVCTTRAKFIKKASQKKVWLAAPGAKLYLFCATLPFCVFFNIFWKFLIFILALQCPKKIGESFFSKN